MRVHEDQLAAAVLDTINREDNEDSSVVVFADYRQDLGDHFIVITRSETLQDFLTAEDLLTRRLEES